MRESLPELRLIKSEELRDKVVEAWAIALAETEYKRIEDIKPSGAPLSPPMKRDTHADRIRGDGPDCPGDRRRAEGDRRPNRGRPRRADRGGAIA